VSRARRARLIDTAAEKPERRRRARGKEGVGRGERACGGIEKYTYAAAGDAVVRDASVESEIAGSDFTDPLI